jgi:hypothetical protein
MLKSSCYCRLKRLKRKRQKRDEMNYVNSIVLFDSRLTVEQRDLLINNEYTVAVYERLRDCLADINSVNKRSFNAARDTLMQLLSEAYTYARDLYAFLFRNVRREYNSAEADMSFIIARLIGDIVEALKEAQEIYNTLRMFDLID